MKKTIMKAGVMAIAILIASCGEQKSKQDAQDGMSQETETKNDNNADIAEATFSDEMAQEVFKNYQEIRSALVDSDSNGVQKAAGNLAESFSQEKDGIKAMANTMVAATDIEKQRELFSELTEKVEPMLKESIATGTLYKQFCPMAFQGEGGYWISNMEEIKNPYYGQKMLKCGKVTEEIQ